MPLFGRRLGARPVDRNYRRLGHTEKVPFAHGRRSGARSSRPREGLPPRPRGRRRRPRRARGRAGRAARSERRGQDHDAADDPRRRLARRGRGDDLRLRPRAPPQPGRRMRRLRRRATSRSPSACACASTCGCTASSTASPIRTRSSTRASSGSASPTSPARWAPSCRRGSARSSASCAPRCTGRACSCSTSRPRRSTPTSRSGCAPGLLDLCDRDGTALLMTSHDMSDVEQVCERVVFLSHGRIVADGTPETVAADVRPRRPRGRVPASRRRHEPSGAQQSDHP